MPDDAAALVTGAELAEWLGVSDRLIRQMAERTIIRRTAPNRYELQSSVRACVTHLREQAAGRASQDDEGGTPDLPKERALLARAQREGQNMKNAVLRSELLPADDVEEVVGLVLDATRARYLALPTKGAPLCVGLADLNAARAVLTQLVHDALTELASTAVVVASAADRARRRIGRGALGDQADASADASAAADGL